MPELLSSRRYRFVGGTPGQPDLPDYECDLVQWHSTRAELVTKAHPSRRIQLLARYMGKVIGPADTDTMTRTCTYTIDDGPPPPEGAHRELPEYTGMATWDEDADGNVTLTAFDYPG